MDPSRLGFLWISRLVAGKPEVYTGTGYVVTEIHVLTAHHVIFGTGEERGFPQSIEFRYASGDEWHPLSLVWPENSDSIELDACLLSLPESLPLNEPLLWGEYDRSGPVPFESVGFPAASAGDPDTQRKAIRDTAHVGGELLPHGMIRQDLYEMSVDAHCETDEWRGLSGAPVFSAQVGFPKYLVAVMRSGLRPFEGRRLYATPVAQLLESQDFAEFVGKPSCQLLPQPNPSKVRSRKAQLQLTLKDAQLQQTLRNLAKWVRNEWLNKELKPLQEKGIFLDVEKVYAPEFVENHRAFEASSKYLPHILDVFDDSLQELLIVGGPSSGKRIQALALAQALLDELEQSEYIVTQPVPALFQISTWAGEKGDLISWMGRELNVQFRLRTSVAKKLIKDGYILPILLGLDALAPQLRKEFIEQTNAYLRSDEFGSSGIVVTCRSEECRFDSGQGLRIRTAVELQPLSLALQASYLKASGANSELIAAIQQESFGLKEFSQTPLGLEILQSVYPDGPDSLDSIKGLESNNASLFRVYVNRLFGLAEQKTGRPFTEEEKSETIHWLSWLGWRTEKHHLKVFRLGMMQPSWLPNPQIRKRYTLFSRIFLGLIAGFVVGSLNATYGVGVGYMLPFDWAKIAAALFYGFLGGLFGGIGLGVIDLFRIEGVFDFVSQQGLWTRRVLFGFCYACICGIASFITQTYLSMDVIYIILQATFWGAAMGGILAYRTQNLTPQKDITFSPEWSWSWRKAAFHLLWLSPAGIVVAYRDPIEHDPLGRVILGLGLGIVCACIFGISRNTSTIEFQPRYEVEGYIKNAFRAMGLIFFSAFVIALATFSLVLVVKSLLKKPYEATFWGVVVGFTFSSFSVALWAGMVAFLWVGGMDVLLHYSLRLFLWWEGEIPFKVEEFLERSTGLAILRRNPGGYEFTQSPLQRYFAQSHSKEQSE